VNNFPPNVTGIRNVVASCISEWQRIYSEGLQIPCTTRTSYSVCRHSADNNRRTWIFCTVWHGLSFEQENRSCWYDRSFTQDKKVMKI